MQKYRSKEAAGEVLAGYIKKLNLNSPYLLAIPRGGVQVAEGIAERLKTSITPLVVKKLPAPGNPEYGFGAITEDSTVVLNEDAVRSLGLSEETIKKIAQGVVSEIKHRKKVYGEPDDEKIARSDVIIVDDGVATGYSLIAGINTVKKRSPKSLTIAVPVASASAYHKIKIMADNVICPIVSEEYYFAVASHYEEWFDLSEDDIKSILKRYS